MSSPQNLAIAIQALVTNETLPPENVIQVLKLYLKDDRVVGSRAQMNEIINFYLVYDRTDVWDLIGTQYRISSTSGIREVDLGYLESFYHLFGKNVKEMITQKKLTKKLRSRIDF